MCGRYAVAVLPEHLREIYKINGRLPSGPKPRYNVAPSQSAPVVIQDKVTEERTLKEMRWGLVPSWARDETIGYKTFNARGETLAEKASFRTSLKSRRCIVPASGFYEWQKVGSRKQPVYFSLKNQHPMGLAGLWAEWKHGEELLHSFTIITIAANDSVRDVHDRMPVILPETAFNAWLDPFLDVEAAKDMLHSVGADELQSHWVSTELNKIEKNGPELVTPLNSK